MFRLQINLFGLVVCKLISLRPNREFGGGGIILTLRP